MSKARADCHHNLLSLDVSPHANASGFERPSREKRLAAASAGGARAKAKENHPLTTFPAPLVLLGDDLAIDPTYPAQSLRQWLRSKDRNEVIAERGTVYLVSPPAIHEDATFMNPWAEPATHSSATNSARPIQTIPKPDVSEAALYIESFYHGMKTVLFPPDSLTFTAWEEKKTKPTRASRKPGTTPAHVGLQTSTECIRIRARPSADKMYPRQLNLNDLLDVAIAILPDDAYALLMLVEQDLYEDDDDLFCCGRAYGGSRVAVVSMARYHPSLDRQAGVDRQHSWPASHCETYISSLISPSITASAPVLLDDDDPSPIEAAIITHRSLPPPSSPSSLSGLWLARVCRTASHELGHCFGIDHCVYYACAMQGSASILEDARQPPYICPVDLSKILRATGSEDAERNAALLKFCHRHRGVHMFAALGAWLEKGSGSG